MVHRPADSRLLTNLLSHEKDYSKHLASLLDHSHASLASFSAYASASSPPTSHVILAVAGTLAGADEALRRYAASVEECRDRWKQLKDLEDEVGNIMRDREILVTRLIKASKSHKASVPIPTRDSLLLRSTQYPSSASSLSLRSYPSSSPTTGTFPLPRAGSTTSGSSKLTAAQAELQACEAHLALKEQELHQARIRLVKEGLGIRCKALVECGWIWGEMGKEALRALDELGTDGGQIVSRQVSPGTHRSGSTTKSNKPLPDPHKHHHRHRHERGPSSDLSSIAPSQSASQINVPAFHVPHAPPPLTAPTPDLKPVGSDSEQHHHHRRHRSHQEQADFTLALEALSTSSHGGFSDIRIPPAHAISDIALPTTVFTGTTNTTTATTPNSNASALLATAVVIGGAADSENTGTGTGNVTSSGTLEHVSSSSAGPSGVSSGGEKKRTLEKKITEEDLSASDQHRNNPYLHANGHMPAHNGNKNRSTRSRSPLGLVSPIVGQESNLGVNPRGHLRRSSSASSSSSSGEGNGGSSSIDEAREAVARGTKYEVVENPRFAPPGKRQTKTSFLGTRVEGEGKKKGSEAKEKDKEKAGEETQVGSRTRGRFRSHSVSVPRHHYTSESQQPSGGGFFGSLRGIFGHAHSPSAGAAPGSPERGGDEGAGTASEDEDSSTIDSSKKTGFGIFGGLRKNKNKNWKKRQRQKRVSSPPAPVSTLEPLPHHYTHANLEAAMEEDDDETLRPSHEGGVAPRAKKKWQSRLDKNLKEMRSEVKKDREIEYGRRGPGGGSLDLTAGGAVADPDVIGARFDGYAFGAGKGGSTRSLTAPTTPTLPTAPMGAGAGAGAAGTGTGSAGRVKGKRGRVVSDVGVFTATPSGGNGGAGGKKLKKPVRTPSSASKKGKEKEAGPKERELPKTEEIPVEPSATAPALPSAEAPQGEAGPVIAPAVEEAKKKKKKKTSMRRPSSVPPATGTPAEQEKEKEREEHKEATAAGVTPPRPHVHGHAHPQPRVISTTSPAPGGSTLLSRNSSMISSTTTTAGGTGAAAPDAGEKKAKGKAVPKGLGPAPGQAPTMPGKDRRVSSMSLTMDEESQPPLVLKKSGVAEGGVVAPGMSTAAATTRKAQRRASLPVPVASSQEKEKEKSRQPVHHHPHHYHHHHLSLMAVVEGAAKARAGDGPSLEIAKAPKPVGRDELEGVVAASPSVVGVIVKEKEKDLKGGEQKAKVIPTTITSTTMTAGAPSGGSDMVKIHVPMAPGSVLDGAHLLAAAQPSRAKTPPPNVQAQPHASTAGQGTPSTASSRDGSPGHRKHAKSPLRSALRNHRRSSGGEGGLVALPHSAPVSGEVVGGGDVSITVTRGRSVERRRSSGSKLGQRKAGGNKDKEGRKEDADDADDASLSSYETGREVFYDYDEVEGTVPPVVATVVVTKVEMENEDQEMQAPPISQPQPQIPSSNLLQSPLQQPTPPSSAATPPQPSQTPQEMLSGSDISKRRKSVRVSLKPTFSPAPPDVEYGPFYGEDDEDDRTVDVIEKGKLGRSPSKTSKASGGVSGLKGLNGHAAAISGPIPDMWEDSSEEDEEYAKAKKLLSAVGKMRKK